MSLSVTEPTECSEDGLLSGQDTNDSRRIALLLLLGALPYLLTLRNGFIYDDYSQIVGNPYVHSFRHLGVLLGSTSWSFQGAEGGLNYYRPLISMLFLLCWSIAGPIPLVYHLLNIVIQAANVGMVYWVTRQLRANAAVATTAAAIFALHPIHTESVAWISGVTDLQLTFFYLLTFGLYLQARRPSASWLTRAAMCASFVMALLSKENAITLPLVALIYEHFCADDATSQSQRLKDAAWRYGPLFLIAALFALIRGLIPGGLPHSIPWRAMNGREAILSGISAAGLYLWKLIWPVSLHLTYPLHMSESLLAPPVLAGLAALCACGLLACLLWRRAKLASFGLVWIVITLAPVLNIRLMGTPFAERFLYLSTVGFCWFLACLIVWAWGELSRRNAAAPIAFACALGIVAALCFVRVQARDLQWHDQQTFVAYEVAANPNVERLRDNLAWLDWQRGDVAAAEREWNESLSLNSQDEVAFAQLASLRSQQRRYPEAIDLFQKAIGIRPTFGAAHLGLGDTYAKVNNSDGAEHEYREAVKLTPVDISAHNLLGELLYDEHRWDEAQEQFRDSVSIEPSQLACDRLGDLAFARGDGDTAIQDYAQATALEPYDGHAHVRLGDLYAASGREPDAIREYQAGLDTNPNDVHTLRVLHVLQSSQP